MHIVFFLLLVFGMSNKKIKLMGIASRQYTISNVLSILYGGVRISLYRLLIV